MVEIRDLRVSYEGEEVLHGMDAHFPKGKISVIIGPNGSGKSTTIKAMMRLVASDSGSVEIDGEPVSSLSQTELARKMAYIPQGRNVPDITVNRMVMHGRFPYLSYPRRYRPEDHEMVRKALEWVGLTDLAHKKMSQLSGGQRQKVYLAMTLAQDTGVILMDEPTTYLDIRNQFELLDRARLLAKEGKTVIMILHDLESVLRYADHVVLMDSGSVTASGTASEVLASEALKKAFGIELSFIETEDGVHCFVKR
ncbi:MAG: ABC transporter ATP-binding protein [Firmicutes bacterium]|nr:ABC transporter ATP-binding protein [Bacillota bacterium]